MNSTLSFAATKIQPPRPRSARVARPAREAALRAAVLDSRVVLLQAPAGFDKTSALAAALVDLPADTATAWVLLDDDDDAPRLFRCIVAALDGFDLPWRTAPEALAAQMGDGRSGPSRALAELVNAAPADSEPAHGVIVLDDLHRVHDRALLDLVDILIECPPVDWTLVLATRVAPPLALARWRAAGELVEFDPERLRFSADEASALAAAHGAGERAAWLFEQAGGWPAGLRLCRSARNGKAGDAQAAGPGKGLMDRHLFDFLIQTSVLPELTAASSAAALFAKLLPHVARLDVMGQTVEISLRAAHALLRCERLEAAARAATPVLARPQRDGDRGQALVCGTARLRELADGPWGRWLAPSARAELKAAAAPAEAVRGAVAVPATAALGAAASGRGLQSTRETEVLALLADGHSNKHIARAFDLSPHTVKRHVANMLDKLAVRSRGQAASWLRQQGHAAR